MIHSLQAARAAAAILVLLFHASGSIFAKSKYWGAEPFGDLFDFGHAGVDFFFVLSGFIIAYAHRGDIGRPERWPSYAWKRFRRIYPPYWVITALLVPVFFFRPDWGVGHEREADTILCSFLLVWHPPGPVLGVAWSLCNEVLFYAAFLAFIAGRRIGLVVFAVWLLFILLPPGPRPFPLDLLGDLRHVQFFLGMLGAAVYVRRTVPAPRLVALLGAVVFLGAGVVETYTRWLGASALLVAYGVGSLGVVLGLAEAERSGGLRVPRMLSFLGAASYAIFLAHVPALSLIAKLAVAAGVPTRLHHGAAFVIVVVLAILAGVAFYLVVERPLLKAFDRRPSSAPASA
ncbi:MAG: acyltransferase [Planctomycetota bacterium]